MSGNFDASTTRRLARAARRGQGQGTGREGAALFAVVPIAILMLSLTMAFVGTAVDSSRANTSDLDSFRARAAAQSAASLAIADLWGAYEISAGNNMQMWTFRTHLEGLGIQDQTGAAKPKGVNFMPSLSLSQELDGSRTIDGVEIQRVEVYRTDNFDSTSLVVEVDAVQRIGGDGSSRERRSSIQETFTVAPPEWDGLDYALLASNVNCLLCHTTIDNVERFYNDDQGLYGSFDMVRVGSIESMHFRSDPDSSVAGVLLIGGDAMEGDGDNISDWTKFNLTSVAMTDGRLDEDIFGDMTNVGLETFDQNSHNLTANLFLDFFDYKDSIDHLDLPTSFPSPFADNGGIDSVTGKPLPNDAGNRKVDDGEFYVSVSGLAGNISGGAISVIKKGDKVNTAAAKTALMKGNSAGIAGTTDGNVYLHGTEANPIILDGDVAVDGDVVISGYVKGMGTIRARGNVYVTSDLVYNDAGGPSSAARTYGYAGDGTENNIAIASGGNIVMGDMYRPGWGEGKATDGTKGTSFNFIMDELAIFNRMEWIKTQPTLPGKTEKVTTGTKTVWYDEKVKEYYDVEVTNWKWVKTGNKIQKSKYKWVTKSNGLPEPYTETWKEKVFSHYYYVDEKEKVADGTKTVTKSKWVKTGNRLSREEPVKEWQTLQHANPYFVANYLPRYYSFSAGQKAPIFNKDGYFDPQTGHWHSEEYAGDWDDSELSYADPNNPNDPYLYGGANGSVLSTITPTDGWIDNTIMREIIQDHLAEEASGSKTFEVDATLYSANSILGTVPDRNSPNTNGTLLVNGGIVAADVGILSPVSTQVNYDVRGAEALSITADLGLVISRRFSAPKVWY
ncbi:MAG: hypothetical protein AAGB93_11800 [Planctomycetota bacterium]